MFAGSAVPQPASLSAAPLLPRGTAGERLRARLHRLGLLQWLALVVVVGFTAMLSGLAVLTGMASEEIRANVEHSRLMLGQMAGAQIDQSLDAGFGELEAALATIAVGPGPQDTGDAGGPGWYEAHVLSRFQGEWTKLGHSVLLVDSRGRLIAGLGPDALPYGADLSDQPFVRAGLASPGRYLSEAFADQRTGRPLVALAVPRRGPTGEFAGAMIGLLALDDAPFTAAIETARRLGQTGHAELIDRRLRRLATTDGDSLLGPGEHPEFYEDAWRRGGQTVGRAEYVVDDDADDHDAGRKDQRTEAAARYHIMAFTPLARAPWAVALGGDENETLAPVHALQRRMVAFGTGSLVLALIGTLVVARLLVRPVHKLSETARLITGGDLETPIVAPAGGEIGVLAANLEEMRRRMRGHLQQAQEWGRELEERVASRTQELARRNRELAATADIAATVNEAHEEQELLRLSLDGVLDLTGADAGGIWLMAPDERTLRLAVQCGLPAEFLAVEGRMRCDHCLCGRVVASAQPAVLADLGEPAMVDGHCLAAGFQALAVIPLATRDGVLGTLRLFFARRADVESLDLRLLTGISQQISVGLIKAHLHEEVERLATLRGQLLRRAVAAQEEERKRIARELHDDTGQALTALLLHLEAVEQAVLDASRPATAPAGTAAGRGGQRALERVLRAKELVTYSLDGVRALVRDLRPTVLDELGLTPAIEWYAQRHLEPVGVAVAVEISEQQRRLPPEVETALFRTIQEALNNIAKHASATRAKVSLTYLEERVLVVVQDDGAGFDVSALRRQRDLDATNGPGFGLAGMEERVVLMGGTLDLRSEPGRGTRIQIEIPVAPDRSAGAARPPARTRRRKGGQPAAPAAAALEVEVEA